MRKFTPFYVTTYNSFKAIYRTGNSLTDFDVIFQIQLSEFIKLLDFRCELKKNCKKEPKYKIDFYKYISWVFFPY